MNDVLAADEDFDLAVAAGLPAGDQPWSYYSKGFRSGDEIRAAILAYGWTEAELQAAAASRRAGGTTRRRRWRPRIQRGSPNVPPAGTFHLTCSQAFSRYGERLALRRW